MARTPYSAEMASFSSTLTFPIVSLPSSSVAISSRIGAIALQGPHQGAQKSTSTGWSLLMVVEKEEESRLAMFSDIKFGNQILL